MKNVPLRELIQECAELHRNLNINTRQHARQNVVSVTESLKQRYDYKRGKYEYANQG